MDDRKVSGETPEWWTEHGGDWQKLEDQPSITCPVCEHTSYNLNDIMQGYCGHCCEYTTDKNKEKGKKEADSGDETM